jgi:hypothetical protein
MIVDTKRIGYAVIGTVFLAILPVYPLRGQTARNINTGANPDCASFSDRNARPNPAGQVLREIDDPATSGQWLLFRDGIHPSGPGRLVRVVNSNRRCEAWPQDRSQGESKHSGRSLSPAVIHAGEMLLLEQHSAVLDAQLEATALEQAALGERLKVRLKVNGKVVDAVATGTGRAALAPADEANR